MESTGILHQVQCLFVALLLFTVATGCQSSDRVSVSGRVTLQNGSPVVGSRVMFRSPGTGDSGSGVTDSDGQYELGGTDKGDGIPPGEYVVAVSEDRGDWDRPKPRTIHAKYESPKTSGLKFTVESDTKIDLKLDMHMRRKSR